MMTRWIAALSLLVLSGTLMGCGGKELGPADPSAVPTANPAEVEKGMQESAKFLPQGAEMPPGVFPESPSADTEGDKTK